MKLFCNCEKEKAEILKTFNETILAVMSSLEKTQNKFVEVSGKIQIQHFKELDKQMENQGKLFSQMTDKFLETIKEKPIIQKNLLQEFEEKLSRIDTQAPNDIEKEEQVDTPPFEDFIPPEGLKNVQFEGQEEIYPIS